MCGIFGVLLRPDSQLSYREVSSTLAKLYELSESRGKESAGLYAYIPPGRSRLRDVPPSYCGPANISIGPKDLCARFSQGRMNIHPHRWRCWHIPG